MADALSTPLLIVNPAAGRRGTDVLARLRRALDEHGRDHDVVVTDGPGHATTLAADAVADGRRYVVAVGGDGTLHEVVNGLVDPVTATPRAPDLVVGIVSDGTGSDFARTFGLDRSPERIAPHLCGTSTMAIDLGRAVVTGPDGRTHARIFANVAEAGFGAEVARVASRLPAALGQRRYVVGIAVAWVRFRRVSMTVTLPTASVTEPVCNVVVANGQFYGGGLHVAPRAIPQDEKFSVQSWGGSVFDVVRAAHQLRTGAHLQRADVRSWTSARVEVDGEHPVRVEADGEVLGTTPATFEILPHAIRLKL
ncbi:MAG: YegS/Rv2252/BmrU family lipid kinase [Nitriliruptoraceae bacterium]